jgi:SAM-dependent methyltransferase
MSETMQVFDRAAVLAHRRRAVRHLDAHGFLFHEAAERLADRLRDIRHTFPLAVDLGGRPGVAARALAGLGGIAHLLHVDAVAAHRPLAVAEEEMLPLRTASIDLVFSNLALHWVNDLPGALLQIRAALRPDGLLLASLFGGDTLHELRHALFQAEMEVEGGVSPRLSPFVDVRDAGMLLQRAGFALPVVDSETVTVTYANAFALMRDLRLMGEGNAVRLRRRGFTRRATLFRAAEIYAREFAGADGRIPATFQLVNLTGWAPAPTQQQPLRPGSAKARLAEALGSAEISTGEKAG